MTDSRIRTIKRIIESFGFKVVEHWQGKHHRFKTECGRSFTAPISPSDHHWENNFRRDVKRAAKERDEQYRLPADEARCPGLLNAKFEFHKECQECRRRIDEPHERQVWMEPPARIEDCKSRLEME